MRIKQNTCEANFTVLANAFPATWRELLKVLDCRNSDRKTKEFPNWWRINGKGYTLWLSEVHLADSASVPPVWRLKLEALTTLPPAGKKHWDTCYTAIEKLFQDAELQYEIT